MKLSFFLRALLVAASSGLYSTAQTGSVATPALSVPTKSMSPFISSITDFNLGPRSRILKRRISRVGRGELRICAARFILLYLWHTFQVGVPGANRTRIVASIFSRVLGRLAAGAALGVASAAMLEKASGDNSMRGIGAVILVIVALFMIAVGFLAALGPARRCLRIEPTEA